MPVKLRNWQDGTTLTEVLVVTVVLNLGTLLVGGMLVESIDVLGATRQQQQAARLAADLGDLLRHLSACTDIATVTPADQDCSNNVCDPQQILAHSLQRWQQRSGRLLPGGRGELELIEQDGLPVAVISLAWQQRGSDTARYSTVVALREAP
jgi:type II secretory pathway pseudopilin PulG